jgi:DNA-binding HxlR family transcriptional regulator
MMLGLLKEPKCRKDTAMSKGLSDNHGNVSHPAKTALGLLSGKWKCIVLFQLLDGTARFSELRRRLPTITQKTLTTQLRELEQAGLIERRVFAQVPARVDYTISAFGLTLEPILRALHGWGQSFGKGPERGVQTCGEDDIRAG